MGLSKYSFSKQEKLTGKKKIEGLFKSGSSFYLDEFLFRHQHLINSDSNESCLYIGFIYLSKQILTFDNIQAQLIQCLERLGNINAE